MAVIARDKDRDWRRRTTPHQLAIWAAWLFGLMIFVYCWRMISDRTIWEFVNDAPTQAMDLGRRMVPPDWPYIAELLRPIWDTIAIATLGTIIAVVLAVPIAFCAAHNTTPSALFVRPLALFVIVASRSINSLIWALMLVTIVGPGVFAGIIAIGLRSIGFCAKLLYEAIEEIDERQVEAVRATGASGAQVMSYGIVPQIMPAFAGISVFRWDINIRRVDHPGSRRRGRHRARAERGDHESVLDPRLPHHPRHHRHGHRQRVGLRQGQRRHHLTRSQRPQAPETSMIDILSRLRTRAFGSAGLLLTLAALFWAGNAIAGRLAVGEITPLTIVFMRWLLVVAVLWPIYGKEVRRHWPAIRGRLPGIVLMATVGFTSFNALFYWASHYTTAVNLGILQGAMPAFVLAGALLAYGTRITLLQIVGVFITIVGVVVVATRGAPHRLIDLSFNFGDILMLIACALYAFYTVALRNRPAMPGAVFFTLLALIAALTALPLLAFEAATTGLKLPTTKGWLVTAYVAIFPSCLAQLFMLRGVDLIGPGRAGVFINFVPVFAAILAVALLAEPFALYHAAALALVCVGVLLAQWTPAAKKVAGTKPR